LISLSHIVPDAIASLSCQAEGLRRSPELNAQLGLNAIAQRRERAIRVDVIFPRVAEEADEFGKVSQRRHERSPSPGSWWGSDPSKGATQSKVVPARRLTPAGPERQSNLERQPGGGSADSCLNQA
jgi:hypothetical protein